MYSGRFPPVPAAPDRRTGAGALAAGCQVWKTVNEVNLVENIRRTRARATLVLHMGADHSVTRVRLRRF